MFRHDRQMLPRDFFPGLIFGLLVTLLPVSGCTTSSGLTLGERVTIAPGWDRLKQSSREALRDPNVWASLLGIVLLQIDNLDEEISDQLREDTPIFGSTSDARDASDDFRSLTELAYVSTALIVPGPETSGDWFSTKAKLLGAEWITVKTTRGITSGLKSLTQRERPNESNDRSFPSGHATSASIQAQMANLNVEYLPIDDSPKKALNLTFDSFAALTSWARVEAGEHYPADVLAGWALGHFMAHLARDFIDPEQQQLMVMPQTGNGAGGIQLVFRF